MLAPFHSTIDSGEHEKYLFLSRNMENPLVAARGPGLISRSEKVQGRLLFSVLSNILQKVSSYACLKASDSQVVR